MVILWLALAWAHEPGGCPPVSLFEKRAQEGKLDDAGRACLSEVAPADVHAAWLLWTDRVVRSSRGAGLRSSRGAGLRAGDADTGDLLARTTNPDEALAAAELTGDAAALRRALELSAAWETAVVRADRRVRVDALVARLDPEGKQAWPEFLPPSPPAPDDLLAASDLGAAWSHALWGKGYATERDAVLRAAEASGGPGRDALARLALLLARGRPDDPDSGIVAGAAQALLPDPAAPGLVSGDGRAEGDR